MFETIDNVTMIKESTGDLSRMRGSASSAAAGSRSATAISSGARTRCGQMAPLGARPRCVCAHGPALAGMTQRVQANCQARKTFTMSSSSAGVHRGRRIGHHGEGHPGATRHRRMEIRAAIATTRRREPRCATEATDIRLVVLSGAKRFGAFRASLGSRCMCVPKNCRERNVFGLFQYSTRVGDLRLPNRSSQNIRVAKFIKLTLLTNGWDPGRNQGLSEEVGRRLECRL
jgi:hypothetical protein